MNIIWSSVNLFILLVIKFIRCDEVPILVHAVFRHGNRTVEKISIYPNDPYKNETYYPYGLGQLTNQGKLHEYKLGQYFRQRYTTFLDDTYTPALLDARSTDVNRTKMSLELVLAGLFPPKGQQLWLDGLNWQPIPYNYWPIIHDQVLFGWLCPSFKKYMDEYEQTDEYQSKVDENREIFQFIAEHTGLTNVTFFDALNLYSCLLTEHEWGFVLPEWTNYVYPEELARLSLEYYRINAATTSMKKLTSGYFLKKIVDDTIAKLNGTLVPQTRKMFLYSAHDIQIATLLLTLGVDITEVPSYGSAIMIEIHQINQTYGVKIFHENTLETEPHLLELPNCGVFCPLDNFIELYQQYFDDINFCYN